MSKLTRRAVVLGIFCFLGLAYQASAQTIISGDITGTVTDATHAVVPDAKITLVSKDTGASLTTTTSSEGTFRFPLLRPGAYDLTVSAPNFGEYKRTVNAAVGEVTDIPVQLEIGTVSEAVRVTATEEVLQSQNANIATTYTPDQIDNIPNPGGDLTNYALSTPGVVLSTGAGYGNFTAFGMGGTSNLYTINGGDMNDPYNNLNNSGASNNMLGQNEIQEVAIVHNGYTGQYGRAASVNMNFTTKSGTNSFHGNAKWDWNGSDLNANDWFNNASGTPKPFANSNEWGGSVGGPIVKNKLFFFYDNEGLRYVLPAGGTPVYIPTPAFAAAVQSNIGIKEPLESAFYKTMFGLYAAAPGASRAVPLAVGDPTIAGGCGDFAGSILGGTLFGAPGGLACTQSFRTDVNNRNNERLQSVRIDYVVSDKDRLSGRYWQDRGTQPTFTDPINSAFNAVSVQPQDSGQFTETHVFNPNLLNQLIIGGFYYSAVFGQNTSGAASVFPTSIGVAVGGNNCLLQDGSLSCIGGEVYRYPQGRNLAQYQLVDDVSWTKGKHALKFGVNFRRVDWADYGIAANHNGDLRISSITDLANGVLTTAGGSVLRQQFSLGTDEQINNYSVGFYGQDEWRATPNLTVTAALRLDRNSNETCTSNCFVLLNGDFLGGIGHSIATPYNQSVATGQSTIFHGIERVVWEPRVGFAWTPFGKNTVVRGGAGIFSDLYPAQVSTNQLSNPPSTAIFTVAGTAAGIPLAPGVPGGAFSQAAANDAALSTQFPSGGTIGSIKAAVPSFAGPNFYTADSHMSNPKYSEWNLEVQHSFGSNNAVSVDYVGNHGWDELIPINGMNAFAVVPGFAGLPSVPIDPRFGVVTQLTNGGVSNYNGLVLSFTRRVTSGFTASVGYTYSRAFDDISNGGIDQYSTNQSGDSLRFQVDPNNRRLNYGPSDYDFRNVVNVNYVWDVPLFKKSRYLGGWVISGVLISRSGEPYSVVNTSITSLVGNYSATGSLGMADYLGGSTPSCNNPDNPCLLGSQFAGPKAQTDFGNLSRNSFRGPSYFDTDLSIKKGFAIRESLSFTIGANAYNVLNHANFGNPDNAINDGTFGLIVNTVTPASSPYGNFQGSAVSGRILQLEAQVRF